LIPFTCTVETNEKKKGKNKGENKEEEEGEEEITIEKEKEEEKELFLTTLYRQPTYPSTYTYAISTILIEAQVRIFEPIARKYAT
jgi:hypothetical protein